MAEKFVLKEEMLKDAVTYMPLEAKAQYALEIAKNCVKPKKTAMQNEQGILPLPTLFFVDSALKKILIGNVFIGFYLNIEIKNNDNPAETYDYFFGDHLFNQLERFKTNAELKEKVFDIIADFKEFKQFVDTEIQNEIANNNDPLGRLSATMMLLGTPENIKKMEEELKKLPITEKKEG